MLSLAAVMGVRNMVLCIAELVIEGRSAVSWYSCGCEGHDAVSWLCLKCFCCVLMP